MGTLSESFPVNRVVYSCELEACPACGGCLSGCGYRSAFKVVQTLAGTLAVAQRPKHCSNPACSAAGGMLRSARWLQLAPSGVTYGFDVIARIGWSRQTDHRHFGEIHAALTERIEISESEVRRLYNERYLALLACHEREQLDQLKTAAGQSGIVLAMDGLAPEGGEPQLWLVRELRTGRVIRCGWMGAQDEAAFVGFLRPIADLQVPVAAVLSDKQRGLVPAVAAVFPNVPHAWCQAHYLNNAAASVVEATEEMKVTLRKDVRERVGPLIRREGTAEAEGVMTVTGLLPSPVPLATAGGDQDGETVEPAERVQGETAEVVPDREREEIVQDVLRRVRYLLTLKARPPLGIAGLEMFEKLGEVVTCLQELNDHQPDTRLVELEEGLRRALAAAQEDYAVLRRAGDWLLHIAAVLDPDGKPPRTGDAVRAELWEYLDAIREESAASPRLAGFCQDIRKVTASYSAGIFHTYDIAGLPRTNNGSESDFREVNRRLLRTTGQKGLTRRLLQRVGAWELLGHPTTLEATEAALSQVATAPFREERERIRAHRGRFRLHTRSAKQSRMQMRALTERWKALPVQSSV